MGFNSGFKGLSTEESETKHYSSRNS